MAEVSIGVSAPGSAADTRGKRFLLTPGSLRLVLVAAVAASAWLAWFATRNDLPARPDLELIRVLQFMTAAKGLIGAAALWMVSIRFRYPITMRVAAGYVAGAAIMASGPGAMWTTAHVIAGSLLFYTGLGALLLLGWVDGGAKWRFGRRAV
jgi:hypothetical protein